MNLKHFVPIFLLFSVASIGVLYTMILPKTNAINASKALRKLDLTEDAIKVCSKGPLKLLYYYASGEEVLFEKYTNQCNAQPLINLASGVGSDTDNIMDYVERIGPFFVFVALAILMLISWFFYCGCCCCPTCCCVQDTENFFCRKMTFVITMLCFLGVFCCSISGLVYSRMISYLIEDVNGASCGMNRFFLDIVDGQNKATTPKWVGFDQLEVKIKEVSKSVERLTGNNRFTTEYDEDKLKVLSDKIDSLNINAPIINTIPNYIKYFGSLTNTIKNSPFDMIHTEYKLVKSVVDEIIKLNSASNVDSSFTDKLDDSLGNLQKFKGDFESFRGDILDPWNDYQSYITDYGYIIFNTFYGALLGFSILALLFIPVYIYIPIKSQRPIRGILHILWNFLTFIMCIFFLLGTVFGALNYVFMDAIGLLQFVFGKDNLEAKPPVLIPSGESIEYLKICFYKDGDLSSKLGLTTPDTPGPMDDLDKLYQGMNAINSIKNQLPAQNNLQTVDGVIQFLDKYLNDISIVADDPAIIQTKLNVLNNNCRPNYIWTTNKSNCLSHTYVSVSQYTETAGNICLVATEWTEKDITTKIKTNTGTTCLVGIFEANFKEILELKAKVADSIGDIKVLIKANSPLPTPPTTASNIDDEHYINMVELRKSLTNAEQKLGPMIDALSSVVGDNSFTSLINCKFMNYDYNILLEEMDDLSKRSGEYCAITIVASFLQAIGIFCLLMVILRYDDRRQNYEYVKLPQTERDVKVMS